jgi:hypothetical protein
MDGAFQNIHACADCWPWGKGGITPLPAADGYRFVKNRQTPTIHAINAARMNNPG